LSLPVYNRRKEGNLDEQGLIANARRGDAGPFEELVRRCQDIAFRTAFLVLRDAAEAEDAAQEAIVRGIASMAGLRGSHGPCGPIAKADPAVAGP
jgi:DNA-directed RNA polymerase specialized sigma24 family protein